jgi:hypothetical protein
MGTYRKLSRYNCNRTCGHKRNNKHDRKHTRKTKYKHKRYNKKCKCKHICKSKHRRTKHKRTRKCRTRKYRHRIHRQHGGGIVSSALKLVPEPIEDVFSIGGNAVGNVYTTVNMEDALVSGNPSEQPIATSNL